MTLNFGNNLFPSRGERIQTYDFIDLVTGTAYKKFYAMETLSGSASSTYRLSPNVMPSQTIVKGATSGTNANAKLIDLTFATTFGIPQSIKGVAIINATAGTDSITGGRSGTFYLVVKIYKNSTLLGTTTSNTETGQDIQKTFALEIDIAKTSYAIGDELKLTMELWGLNVSASDTVKFGLGIDPQSRNNPDASSPTIDSGEPTELEFLVPFQTQID